MLVGRIRQEVTVPVGVGTLTYELGEPWQVAIEGPSPDIPGVAVNSKDEVHVLTRSPHPVLVFDQKGRFLRSWGEGLFRSTHGIHIGPDDCVYIVDAGDSTVRKFSPSGELLFQLGSPGQTTETGFRDSDYRTISRGGAPFNAPTNLAVAPSNELYVSDGYGNARVHRFTEDGQLIASWGAPGSEPGQFHIPHGIFVDRHGTVYVADRENSRVQRFTADGAFIDQWTDVRRPDTVFVTDDDLAFVAELGFIGGQVPGMSSPTPESLPSRVTVRDLTGRILAALGGDDPGRLCEPGNFFAAHGICVDRQGTIYVGEVIAAVGPRRQGDFGWVPRSCHALQVFHRA
jgi:DNA-binding beta-propeller fold protein YncE